MKWRHINFVITVFRILSIFNSFPFSIRFENVMQHYAHNQVYSHLKFEIPDGAQEAKQERKEL